MPTTPTNSPRDSGATASSAGRRRWVVAALVVALVVVPVTGLPGPPTGATVRPLPAKLWGVTLDNTADIRPGALDEEVASLQALPTTPIARVVMDVGTKPAAYRAAVDALHPLSYLMAELGDSSEMRNESVAAYKRFEQALVTAYSGTIELWEIGNEVNGEWVGSTSKEVAKITDAYESVTAVGGATELTLYYNPDCFTKPSHEMFTWAQANIPAFMKAALDDVLISYYPDDCHNYWPSPAGWQSVFDRLHTMFPNARIGFGESGISTDRGSSATKAALLSRYYSLAVSGDNYVGGYFWWYYAEDALPYQGNDVWNALDSAMTTGPTSGGGRPETMTSPLTPRGGPRGDRTSRAIPPPPRRDTTRPGPRGSPLRG